MIIAHLSDLHISRFGTSLTQMRGLAREAKDSEAWEVLRTIDEWRIESQPAEGRRFRLKDRLRLVDGQGTIHSEVKASQDQVEATIGDLLTLMERRVRASAANLAKGLPPMDEVRALLKDDPDNGNLRFCAVAHQLRLDAPDRVLVTGDLTDDAEGFELIVEGLHPFIDAGRLVAIPGNHDIYPSPPLVTTGAERKTEAEKRRRWSAFSTSIGLPAGGSFLWDLGEGVVLACLDSCHPPRIPGSASGQVLLHELHHLRGALDTVGGKARLGCLHHHIANPPTDILGSTPVQAGMRLRNAKEVLDIILEMEFEAVLNGHRHLGYRFHPAKSPLFLSAPSTTMGCRSGASPFYWRLDISEAGLGVTREVPIEALGPKRLTGD